MSASQQPQHKTSRLEGLDLARFLAFAGMVIVNFRLVLSGDSALDPSFLSHMLSLLEGRAAATFVVLAGIGLGLASNRECSDKIFSGTALTTLKRALFLLILGLINMLIFDADILHYYAVYFLIGACLLWLRTSYLITGILLLNIFSVVLIIMLDFTTGWNFSELSYQDFWTPEGFIRHLFFNGWHPVIPWLSFLLFGIILSRCQLHRSKTQWLMIALGIIAVAEAEIGSWLLQSWFSSIDPELAELVSTSALPPMPLYILASGGVALAISGGCLLVSEQFHGSRLIHSLTPAGRQSLTLYMAHILIGLSPPALLGLTGTLSLNRSLLLALLFCALSVLFAYIWAQHFQQGPLESLMRKLTS